jgi:hypothetical protein
MLSGSNHVKATSISSTKGNQAGNLQLMRQASSSRVHMNVCKYLLIFSNFIFIHIFIILRKLKR